MNTDVLQHTFIKFIFVGVLNTIFGYLIFSGLIFLGLHYSIAMLLATCLGVLFNFKTIGALVFKKSDNKLLGKFILVYIVTYFINITIIKFFSSLHVNIYFAGAIAIIIAAICSYLLNKNWVFVNE